MNDQSATPAQRHFFLPWQQREITQSSQYFQTCFAHVIMLAEQKIISKEDGVSLVSSLSEMRDRDAADISEGKVETFIVLFEEFVAKRLGDDVAGTLNTALSRIDQNATVWRLYIRGKLVEVTERIVKLQRALLNKASDHLDTAHIYYTHLQQAQPSTWAHYLLAFVEKFEDDLQRCEQAFVRTNRNPLGTVARSGTAWPIDRHRTEDLLGFEGLILNSFLGRDAHYAVEILGCLSLTMSDLNDLATDLHLWSSQEFGFVKLPSEFCANSAQMPHKRNPVVLETIKVLAGEAALWQATGLATFRGAGTGDQIVHGVPAHLDRAFKVTYEMLELTEQIIVALIIDCERPRKLLTNSWTASNNLADVLVQEYNISFRQSHKIVGKLVTLCEDCDKSSNTVSPEELKTASSLVIGREIDLTQDNLTKALDPMLFIASRVSEGSVGPLQVEKMQKYFEALWRRGLNWVEERKANIQRSEEELDRAAACIMNAGSSVL